MGHDGHDHEHDAGHGHAHDHGTGRPHGGGSSLGDGSGCLDRVDREVAGDRPSEELLSRGAGVGKLLFFDAPSGLAGDMIVAALVDLGVPGQVVADALASLAVSGFHVHFGTRVRSGIVATSFEVHVDAPQPPRTYGSVRALLDAASLPAGVRTRAHATFRRLAEAEAKVHRAPIDDVHFHEVGAIDAIADVVGSAAALDYLGAELVVSPLPLGRGFVTAAHGRLPLPAPATVDCLAGLATYDGGLDFEFVTPTGAAIVGAHASGSHRWPAMAPERSGFGAGTAELRDRPNVLRAVLGKASSPNGATGWAATHAIVEANVDDASGELAANWVERLLAEGALDAWVTPITMKKGRPAMTISALAPLTQVDAIAHALLRETTSLGLRRYDVSRLERPRTLEQVETPYGLIPIKIATGPFGPPQMKPEFDACAAAAATHGVPVREVLRAAMAAAAARFPRE
jgi:pyridinium-3,5-bisthiocarboxylic acid mononucleotide nickel chelatase